MKKYGIIALAMLAVALFVQHTPAAVKSSSKIKNAYQRRELTLKDELVGLTTGGTGTNGFGGVKIFDFDEGRVLIHGVVTDLTVEFATNKVADTGGINLALGTATAIVTTGAIAHTSTRADLTANIEVDPWVSTLTNSFQGELAASAQFDGTTTAKDMYLNLLVDSGDITGTPTGTVNGTIIVTYSILGDY